MFEQHAERLGLDRVQVEGQEVIAEGALLLVTDPVGLENVLPTRGARHYDGDGLRIIG